VTLSINLFNNTKVKQKLTQCWHGIVSTSKSLITRDVTICLHNHCGVAQSMLGYAWTSVATTLLPCTHCCLMVCLSNTGARKMQKYKFSDAHPAPSPFVPETMIPSIWTHLHGPFTSHKQTNRKTEKLIKKIITCTPQCCEQVLFLLVSVSVYRKSQKLIVRNCWGLIRIYVTITLKVIQSFWHFDLDL